MANKPEAHISESMTDMIKFPTATLLFSTTASPKKMSLGNSNNDRQPEKAADTGNTYFYISKTMKDVKIPTTNLKFTTIDRSKKVSASDCNSDRQSEVTVSTTNDSGVIEIVDFQ